MRILMIVLCATWASVAAAGPLEGDVQVWEDARLYLAPSDTAETVALPALDKPRAERTGRTFEMRVVAEHGDFVEVAKLGMQEYRNKCRYWSELSVDPRLDGLHLFVLRSDLAPVLTRPWNHTFEDGTTIAVSPGEPVGPSTNGGRVLALSAGGGVAPATFVADLPSDAIGYAFTSPARSETTQARPLEIATTTVAVGGRTLAFDHALPLVAQVTPRGDRALVPVDVGCVQLVASVPRKQVRKYKPQSSGALGWLTGGSEPSQLPMLVPRGTALSTPSGTRVAIARDDFPIAPTKSVQACSAFELGVQGAAVRDRPVGTFSLCAPASALVRAPGQRTQDDAPRGAVEHGEATVAGGLDVAVLRRVVRRADSDLLACYEAALHDHPELRGTLTVSFTVGENGGVGGVTAAGVAGLETCVAGVVGKLSFPRPTGIARVHYPLTFRPLH